MIRIIGVTPENFEDHWKYASKFVMEAVNFVDINETVEDVTRSIINGERQLWIVGDHEAYMLTKIVFNKVTLKKKLIVIALGGEGLHRWLADLLQFLDFLAKDKGCYKIGQNGRLGWQKLLKTYGYEPKSVYMERIV